VLVLISISLKLSVCRTVSEIFSVKKRHDLETRGRGRSSSLKMESIDRSHDFLLVPFESLGVVSYSLFIVNCVFS